MKNPSEQSTTWAKLGKKGEGEWEEQGWGRKTKKNKRKHERQQETRFSPVKAMSKEG